MTNQEIYDYYEKIPKRSRGRVTTDHFNSLTLEARKSYISFLESLPSGEVKLESFTKLIRKQAVQDFWDNERALILDGKCTRDWTPEQI